MRTANYKYIAAVTIVLFAFGAIAAAQDAQKCIPSANRLTAEKIDEFGHIDDNELYINVAVLFERLKSEPAGTYAYVITYKSVDTLPADRGRNHFAELIRAAMRVQQQTDAQFVMIDGGYRKTDGAEFFFVEAGSKPPLPSKTVPAPKTPKGTVLWAKNIFPDDDVYEFVNRAVVYRDLEEHFDEDTDGRPYIPDLPTTQPNPSPTGPLTTIPPELQNQIVFAANAIVDTDNSEKPPLTAEELDAIRFSWANKKFASAVAKTKGSYGIMIYYADDQFYDISRLEPFIAAGRDRMVYAARIFPESIQIIFGGYRSQPQVEYWLVPDGSDRPVPKPEDRDVSQWDN